jgi:hypothetical protein
MTEVTTESRSHKKERKLLSVGAASSRETRKEIRVLTAKLNL